MLWWDNGRDKIIKIIAVGRLGRVGVSLWATALGPARYIGVRLEFSLNRGT